MPKKLEKKEEKKEEKKVEQQPVSKLPFAKRWFKDYAVNNPNELKIICDLTARSVDEQFQLRVNSGNNEVFGCIFYATFLTILDFLKEKRKHHKMFTIEIANSINIGFTNNLNEDNEKVGNFMPVLEYIGINRNVVNNELYSDNPNQTNNNFLMWKELNTKKNIDQYKEIQENAYRTLEQNYSIALRTSEAIIPIFCVFMDYITNVIRMKFKEAEGTDVSEVKMNVFGLFDIYYSFDEEDNREVIDFQPNILMKLRLKSDEIAGVD